MSTTIELVKKGRRKEMEALYNSTKTEVMFLCRLLLDSEKTAASAVAPIYQNLWDSLLAGEIASEEAFFKRAQAKTISYCINKTKKKNPRAFQIPENSSFSAMLSDQKLFLEGDPWEMLLHSLPELLRFLYVLHAVCGYDSKRLSSLLEIKKETVDRALEEEEALLDQLCGAISAKKKIPFRLTVEEFHDELKAQKELSILPDTAHRAVLGRIDSLSLALRKKDQKKKIILAVVAGVVVIGLIVVVAVLLGNSGSGSSSDDSVSQVENVSYYADIEIQDYGTITVALDAEAAPETVENFVNLAESGFYDGLTFHRIIDGFMMQGGDPEGDGTGGSDTTITGEFSDNGFENNLSHTRGAISMARSQDYDSASSQFFIVHEDSTYLDGQYACFGYVTEGMDIVDAICSGDYDADSNGVLPADRQPVITSITIRDGATGEAVVSQTEDTASQAA